MGPGSVAHDEDANGAAPRTGCRDQAAAPEAFVVRMRSDDDEAAFAEALLQ
jgi:hypothetical protein